MRVDAIAKSRSKASDWPALMSRMATSRIIGFDDLGAIDTGAPVQYITA